MRFAIVIEKGENNYGAYVPDLPGCITTGSTVEEVKRNMVEAIELHLYGMWEDQDPIPSPECLAEYVDVPDEPEAWEEGVIKIDNEKACQE